MIAITERQREILGFVIEATDREGYPPTLREIGNRFGIRSTNGVNDHLQALEKKGYLTRPGTKSRALRITAEGRALCGPRDPRLVEMREVMQTILLHASLIEDTIGSGELDKARDSARKMRNDVNRLHTVLSDVLK